MFYVELGLQGGSDFGMAWPLDEGSPLSGLIRPAVQLPGNYWAAVGSVVSQQRLVP